MEKALSREERIRRAEEIYNRRRAENRKNFSEKYSSKNGQIYQDDARIRVVKKVFMQIFTCVLIYLVLYVIQNMNLVFSDDIKNKLNEVLAYDISFENLYENINNILNNINANVFTNNEENENNIQEEVTNEVQEEKVEEQVIPQNDIAPVDSISVVEEVIPKTQDELDIEYIKNNYNIIWPLNGVITSKFGKRTPTDIVTANHYGLDIGGNMGSDIIAAMDGTVTLVSVEGDYGKHIKIERSNVTTLYAHCSTLCVKEGEEIKQGEKIAEVGSTGRSTGPHLHFEVRVDNRPIDPELIL